MSCPFCRIVDGDDPADIVRRFDGVTVIRPLGAVSPDHYLVIPDRHITNWTSASLSELHDVMSAAWLFASEREFLDSNVITSAGPAATQTVPHFHVHVIGRRHDDGLTIPWGKLAHEHTARGEAVCPWCNGRGAHLVGRDGEVCVPCDGTGQKRPWPPEVAASPSGQVTP